MISKRKDTPKKPTRPLSAYNLFFRYERTRILKGIQDGSIRIQRDTENESSPIRLEDSTRFKKINVGEVREIVFKQSFTSKRKHRKTHGKITFTELIKYMGRAWATLKVEYKQVFELLASEEKERYADRVRNYNKENQKTQLETTSSAIPKYYNENSDSSVPNSETAIDHNYHEMEYCLPVQSANQLKPSFLCSLKNHEKRCDQDGHYYGIDTNLDCISRQAKISLPPNFYMITGKRMQYKVQSTIDDDLPDAVLDKSENSFLRLETSYGNECVLGKEPNKILQRNGYILQQNFTPFPILNTDTSLRSENIKGPFTCITDIALFNETSAKNFLTEENPPYTDEESDLAEFLLEFDWSVF